MQLLQPTGVTDVGLPAGYVLGVTNVDQNNLKALLFEYLIS